jgi:hypothetical protein
MTVDATIDPEDFQRLRRIFEAALARPPAERAAFVATACGGDDRLRADVERMLAAEDERHSLIDRPQREVAAKVTRLASSDTIPVGGFTPGTILGSRYRIIGLLGRGGMGEVYRADDLKLGQPVALKFLPAALATDPVRRERFFAEVRITRQLSHPNICRVYDIEEVDGLHFLSMEYIDGEDLDSLLKRIGHLSNEKALDIARQLVLGVAAAHERGVLHRDLKPANVMLDGHGRVRITDFGLAIAAGEEEPGDTAGTPVYMAPEQLAGKGASVRSDIYALGLVFYEICTGRRAFTATSLAELRDQKEHEAPAPPSAVRPTVDPIVERVIMRCLERDPRLRPGSLAAIASALPGGDPLEAAIAAGGTPSPGMVAALGERDGLRPLTAWALLLFVIAGSAAIVAMRDYDGLLRELGPSRSPDVLVDRAQTIVRELGFSSAPADTDFGFIFVEEQLDAVRTVRGDTLWPRARAQEPMLFWYRQSARPLARRTAYHLFDSRLAIADPPLGPGDLRIFLSTDGALRRLDARDVPQDAPQGPLEPLEPLWERLISFAGSDPARVTTDTPMRTPSAYADARAAWIAPPPTPGAPMRRIEAAALRGRLVAFEVDGPWEQIVDTPYGVLGPSDSGLVRDLVGNVLVVASAIGGGFVARRNLRLGRGDRRGATRIAIAVLAIVSLWWLVDEHHVFTFWELALLVMTGGSALFMAALIWVWYVAFEPFVRRRWPQVLVSWTRVLAGDWRDPRVGRDLLLGCATGVTAALLFQVQVVVPATQSRLPPGPPALTNLHTFLPPRSLLGGLSASLLDMIFASFLLFVVLFLLRLVLRRDWLALTVWGLFGSLVNVSLADFWLSYVVSIATFGVIYIVLMQGGFFPYMVGRFMAVILLMAPLTFDRSMWYADTGYAALAVALAVAAYGFWTSMGGHASMVPSAREVG